MTIRAGVSPLTGRGWGSVLVSIASPPLIVEQTKTGYSLLGGSRLRHWLATPLLAPIFREEVLSLYVADRWLMVSIITQKTQRRNPWYMILEVACTAKISPALRDEHPTSRFLSASHEAVTSAGKLAEGTQALRAKQVPLAPLQRLS